MEKERREKYIIFGTSISTEKFLYQMGDRIEVVCFLDNNQGKDVFYGKSVYTLDSLPIEYRRNYKIIVCSGWNSYFLIRRDLKHDGYGEFTDFFHMNALKGKKVVIVGNCNMTIIREFLKQSKSFLERYSIYPLSIIPEIDMQSEYEDLENAIRNCDLLIIQYIREENKYGKEYSLNYLKKFTKPNTQIIVCPNLYMMAKMFHPNFKMDRTYAGVCAKFFPYEDPNVREALREGVSKKEIVDRIESGTTYSKEEILHNFSTYIDGLKKREKECTIAISDFIEKEYRNKKLFFDLEHPTNVPLKEMTTRILHVLGLENDILETELAGDMGKTEIPIYPEVIQSLGLVYDTTYIRVNSDLKLVDIAMTRREYYEEYLYLQDK